MDLHFTQTFVLLFILGCFAFESIHAEKRLKKNRKENDNQKRINCGKFIPTNEAICQIAEAANLKDFKYFDGCNECQCSQSKCSEVNQNCTEPKGRHDKKYCLKLKKEISKSMQKSFKKDPMNTFKKSKKLQGKKVGLGFNKSEINCSNVIKPTAICHQSEITNQDNTGFKFFDGCNECTCNKSVAMCNGKICQPTTDESKSKAIDYVCKVKLLKIEYHLANSKAQDVDCTYGKHICRRHPGATFSDGCKECTCASKSGKRSKAATVPRCVPASIKNSSCQFFGTTRELKKLCKEKHKIVARELNKNQMV